MHIYTHTCTHIYIRMNEYAHVCTDRKSQQQRLNESSYIIDRHTHPYTYACIHTHIYIYTYVHNLQRVCSQMCTLVYKHTCVTYIPAHALIDNDKKRMCTCSSGGMIHSCATYMKHDSTYMRHDLTYMREDSFMY